MTAWWNDAWTRRRRITIDSSRVGGAGVTDFPVSIDLTGDPDVQAHAASDLRDLRFVDGDGNLLDHDVERQAQQVYHDGLWTWFTGPRARYIAGKLWVTWVSKAANTSDPWGSYIGVTAYDPETGESESFELDESDAPDDHNNAGLIELPDGRVMAFYSYHDNDEEVRYRVTTNPGDVSAWDTEVQLTQTGTITYPKPARLEAEGRIYVFFREVNGGGVSGSANGNQYYITSDDDGETWSSHKRLVNGPQPYLNMWDNGDDRIDFITTSTGNPNNGGQSLHHFYIQGGNVYQTDGTLITALSSLGTHDGINTSSFTKIHDLATEGSCWGWDITRDEDGHPVVVYAKFAGGSTDPGDHSHVYARWNGSAWVKTTLCVAGDSIQTTDEPHYSPGISVMSEDPNVVYLSRKTGGASYSEAVLAHSPDVYSRLDETAGTNADDATANNRDGTYGSGVTLDVGGALAQDANTGVTLDNSANGKITYGWSPFTGPKTYVIWVDREDSADADTILSGTGSNCPSLAFASGSQDVVWSRDISSGVGTDGTWTDAGPENDRWIMYVLVDNPDDSEAELFVNGESLGVKSVTRAFHASPGNLLIGIRGTNANPLNGSVDEPAVIDGELTAVEIKRLYQLGARPSSVGSVPSDAHDIERWETADNGATWTSEKVTMGGTTKQVRPICPWGRQGTGPEAVWFEGFYRRNAGAGNYNTRVMCSPGFEDPPTMARVKVPELDDTADEDVWMYYANPAATSVAQDVFPDEVLRRHANYGRRLTGDLTDFVEHERFALESAPGLTLEAWVDELGPNDAVVDNLVSTWGGVGGTAQAFLMRANVDGQVTGFVVRQSNTTTGGTFTLPNGMSLRDGHPHHLVMSYDTTGGLQLWADGHKAGTTFAGTTAIDRDVASSPPKLNLGRSPDSVGSRLTVGRVEDVRYHFGKLSDDRIVTLSNDRMGLASLGVPDVFGGDIMLDPPEVSVDRTPLGLNYGSLRIIEQGIDWGDAQIEQYLAELQRGSTAVDYRMPNRTINIPMIIGAPDDEGYAEAKRQLQAKVALIHQEGGWLRRRTGLYADVVNATLRIPERYEHRGFEVDVVLTLEALPDFYEDESEVSAASETAGRDLTAVVSDQPGGYPGRVRLRVTDGASQDIRGLLGGFRSRHYSPLSTARLSYEADDLEALDAATASGGEVEHANLGTTWTPVLGTNLGGTSALTHTGTYRVWALVNSDDGSAVRLRFVWDVGDLLLPEENPHWLFPGAANDYIADLGEIRIDRAPLGDHGWQGWLMAKGETGGEHVGAKHLWFQPLDEAAWRLWAPLSTIDGLSEPVARDEFNQGSGALNGKTAAVGGNWVTAGDASIDWQVSGGSPLVSRTVTAIDLDADLNTGRYAVSGASALAAQIVEADLWRDAATSGDVRFGVLARYSDTSNWLLGHVLIDDTTTNDTFLVVTKRVAGTVTELDRVLLVEDVLNTFMGGTAEHHRYRIRLRVLADGIWTLDWGPTSGNLTTVLSGKDSALATGGALDDGKPGFYVAKTGGASNQFFVSNFIAYPPVNDAVLFSGQDAELRTEGMFRTTGTAAGPVSFTTGDLPRIPASGLEQRPVELFLLPSDGDFDTLPHTRGTADISVSLNTRASWPFPPAS